MAEAIYDFDVNPIFIGTMKLIDPEGTPQRIQTERFSDTDGTIASFHGTDQRQLIFEGVLDVTNTVGAYDQIIADILAIQSYINLIATLRVPFGDTVKDYLFCRMDDYRRIGTVGFNVGILVTRVRARFTQLYW